MNTQEKYTLFERFIDGHKLPYIEGKQFTPHWDQRRGNQQNGIPASILWHHIIPTIQILNLLHTRLHSPICLLASYRSPGYLRAIGASLESTHGQFNALDIYSLTVPAARLYGYLKELRDHGVYRGGLGLYKDFVHIDTRGYNVSWSNIK